MAFADVSLRVALAATFLLAAGSKVYRRQAWQSFRTTIRSIGLVPPKASATTAAMVVGAEFATALLLLIPYGGIFGLAACILLVIAFSGVIARSMGRKEPVPCRCFGRTTEPMGTTHLYRNIIMLAMAMASLVLAVSSRPDLDTEAVVIGIPIGIFGAFVLTSFTEFSALLQSQPITRNADSR